MRWSVVAGLAVVVLAAGLALWSRRHHVAARATPDVAPTHAAPQVATGASDEPDHPAEEEGDDDTEFVSVPFRGTIVVDEDGRHLASHSGTFELHIDFFHVNVEVSDGSWQADVRLRRGTGTTVSFENIVLSGRQAIADPATVDTPEDGVVEVRCRWFVPAQLSVLGEEGKDLVGVELAERHCDEIVPVDNAEIVGAGASPITIPGERAGLLRYWVRASGHAWARVSLWQGDGGHRAVRLARAGTLEVRLVPFDPETEVALHVWRGGEYVLGWQPDEAGLCRIEGLPPGRLELRAATGLSWNERVYGTCEVEIEAGKMTEALLSMRSASRAPEPVRVEGTLHVSPGWGEPDAPGLRRFGADASRIVVDDRGGFEVAEEEDGRWSVDLVPGHHWFTVRPWGWKQPVEVGPLGTKELRLVVPPPCDVEVHLLDAASGVAVPDGGNLWWYVTTEHADWDFFYVESQPSAVPGIWRFTAPIGTLAVHAWDELYEAEAVEVELKPGKNRIDLKASPNFSCKLALKDGTIPVPVDEDMEAALRAAPLDGDGQVDSVSRDFPSQIWFTKAGRYRLTFPAIEGYEPIAPIEVEITAGKIPLIEVALKRR